MAGIVGLAAREDFVVACDQAHFGLRDGFRRCQRIDEDVDAVIAGERRQPHVRDDEPLRRQRRVVLAAGVLRRCGHDINARLQIAERLVHRKGGGDVLVQRGRGRKLAGPHLDAALIAEVGKLIAAECVLEIAADHGVDQVAVTDPEYVDGKRRRVDADQGNAALAGARQHIGAPREADERLAVAHIDVELGRFRQALLHGRRQPRAQIDVVALAVLQPLDAKLLAFRGQRRLVSAGLRHEGREVDAFGQFLRELEAGARRSAVGIHGVIEQAEAVLVAQLLILSADIGDLAHVERQPQRIERRPPQFAVGHRPAKHSERIRFLTGIAGALISDVGRRRGALEQESLFGRGDGADLEDGAGESQPVAAIVRRGGRDLAKQVEAGAEIIALEGSIRVGLQGRGGLGDGPRLLLDLGLQLDRGIGEVVAFEGLVSGQRRIQAKRQRGANSCGAYQTDHGETPWAADKGRARHKRQRKGDGLMAG